MIELPDVEAMHVDWRLLEQNTLGEFNVSLLLDGYLPAEQARLKPQDGMATVLACTNTLIPATPF